MDIPHLCHIEMTYECNQNCIFCYNPHRGDGTDLQVVDSIVCKVAEAKVPHVYLIGGEPSMISTMKLNEYIDVLDKTSSVTIVTNGYKTLKGISDKLACIAVPLHGYNSETHEMVNGKSGSFEKTIESIKYYASLEVDLRCVIVLTGYNFDTISQIIDLAVNLGVDSIYIDRYEDGGIGAANSSNLRLKPSLGEFRQALGDIIEAKKRHITLKGGIHFGTAIPFCVDERMFYEEMISSCGAGTTFCAINNCGDVRVCNQSDMVFGNILETSIIDIWNSDEMNKYQDLQWVQEPCKSCRLLEDCQCGCRVDTNCSCEFCIDYAVREMDDIIEANIKRINNGDLSWGKGAILANQHAVRAPGRTFVKSRYLKLNTYGQDDYVVTQYQATQVGPDESTIVRFILSQERSSEIALRYRFPEFEEDSLGLLVSQLLYIGAIQWEEDKK